MILLVFALLAGFCGWFYWQQTGLCPEEITVTDDNVVLMHQKHFYDQNKSQAETVKQENLNSARLHIILYHMHVAFKSYFILEAYARRLGKEIINVTPGSYIDAFKRMKL